jgi:hypothetical protein
VVPLDHVRGDRQVAEQRIRGRVGALGHELCAELGTVRVAANPPAHRDGQQLGAEADGKRRGLIAHRLREQRSHGRQPRRAFVVGGRHAAAENDQTVVSLQIRQRPAVAHVECQAGLAQPIAQPPDRVGGRVLHDENTHAARLLACHA